VGVAKVKNCGAGKKGGGWGLGEVANLVAGLNERGREKGAG
jgi:hypothetical protein